MAAPGKGKSGKGKSKSGNRKHGRKKKKPGQQRYVAERRHEKNKKRKQEKHTKRLERVERCREESILRRNHGKAVRLLSRVDDPLIKTTHIRPELIEKARQRVAEYIQVGI